eukprot:6214601-Amphidinium_carterae.1
MSCRAMVPTPGLMAPAMKEDSSLGASMGLVALSGPKVQLPQNPNHTIRGEPMGESVGKGVWMYQTANEHLLEGRVLFLTCCQDGLLVEP